MFSVPVAEKVNAQTKDVVMPRKRPVGEQLIVKVKLHKTHSTFKGEDCKKNGPQMRHCHVNASDVNCSRMVDETEKHAPCSAGSWRLGIEKQPLQLLMFCMTSLKTRHCCFVGQKQRPDVRSIHGLPHELQIRPELPKSITTSLKRNRAAAARSCYLQHLRFSKQPANTCLPDIRTFMALKNAIDSHRTFSMLQAKPKSMVRHLRFPNVDDATRHLAAPHILKRQTIEQSTDRQGCQTCPSPNEPSRDSTGSWFSTACIPIR
jgi:hypothetical protein